MAIVKLLSFAGTGAIALSPFTLLAFSKEKIVSPILKAKLPQIKTNVDLSDKTLDISGPAGGATISLPYLTETKANSVNISVIQSPSQTNQSLSSSQNSSSPAEVFEDIKLEANLNEGLDYINPGISKGNELIFITRGESGYFSLVKGDKDCQCFLKMDDNVGIGTNGTGMLTIGQKGEDPHKQVISLTENSQCKEFDSFWWQNGNTGKRFQSGLKTTKNDENSHKAISSCYKYPVAFLDINKLIPLFTRNKGNIIPAVPMHYHYDLQNKKFLFAGKNRVLPKNSFSLRNYSDGAKLGKLEKTKQQ